MKNFKIPTLSLILTTLVLSIMVTPFDILADDVSKDNLDSQTSEVYESIPDGTKMPQDFEVPMVYEDFEFENVDIYEEEFGTLPRMRSISLFSSAEPRWGSFTGSNGTVTVYHNASGDASITYIANGSYNGVVPILDEQGSRVKIAVGGIIGWISKSSVKLTDFSKAKSFNRYVVNANNEFVHRISSNADGTSYSSNLLSHIPYGVERGKEYISFDGHYFYYATLNGYNNLIADYNAGNRNRSVNKDNPFYNYFQFLPLKAQTKLTAKDLKNYLPEKYHKSYDSRLANMEQIFMDQGNRNAVNPVAIYATAIHESAYGTSGYARWRNNYFGHNAYDSSPGSASVYPTPNYAIWKHTDLIRWNYSDIRSSSHYRGGILGNKAMGMNVVYASDPYWGEKIASYYYEIDRKAGFKDLNQYTLGIVTNTKAAIKDKANSSSKTIYTSHQKDLPIAVIETIKDSSGNTWYGFSSESLLDSSRNLQAYSSGNMEIKTRAFDLKSATVYVNSKDVKIVSTGKDSNLRTQPMPSTRKHPVFIDVPKDVYTIKETVLRVDNSDDFAGIATIPKGIKISLAELTEDGWLMVQLENKDIKIDHIGYVKATDVSYKRDGTSVKEDNEAKPEVRKLGDINGNKQLDSSDMAILQSAILGKYKLSSEQFKAADINGNGQLDSSDMAMLQSHLLGKYKIKGW